MPSPSATSHLACLLVASAAAFGTASTARAAAAVGQPAPEFTATGVDGKPVRLADFRGKYVVLEWTNPGCPFVRKHYQPAGNMPTLQKDFTARGVAWLAVNSTEPGHPDYLPPGQLAKWFGERGAHPTAVLLDETGSVGRAYGARTTPHMYVVDPAGRLVYAGAIDSIRSADANDVPAARNHVREALGEALAGKPITTATSTPYGCSVKYAR